jgi:hypothetical protein
MYFTASYITNKIKSNILIYSNNFIQLSDENTKLLFDFDNSLLVLIRYIYYLQYIILYLSIYETIFMTNLCFIIINFKKFAVYVVF